MPHPIYAWLNWIAILSPNIENVEMIKHLFDISYEKVTHSFQKKQPITFSQLAKKAKKNKPRRTNLRGFFC